MLLEKRQFSGVEYLVDKHPIPGELRRIEKNREGLVNEMCVRAKESPNCLRLNDKEVNEFDGLIMDDLV